MGGVDLPDRQAPGEPERRRLRYGIILLTPRRRIRWISSTAAAFLKEYFRCDPKTNVLPEALTQWIALEESRGLDRQRRPGPDHQFTVHALNRELTVRLVIDGREQYLVLHERIEARAAEAFRELRLTAREREVLGWLAKGRSNPDIAAILGVRVRTVAKHLERIFQVLGVDNRTAAAVKVHRILQRRTDSR